MKKLIKTVGISAMLMAGSLVAGNAAPASAAGLDDVLGSVNSLVGKTNVSSGSVVSATGPNFEIQAGSTYTVNQDGVTGLLGGVLGGTYNTNANLSGPNGLSASASTNGGYGLASSVQSLTNGLGGLLGGLLK
ncbi:hypothetical protein NST81_17505 [Bacillus sp. FSL W8-0223]|jgi:hypothetical protein|uniref:hypothetical protein n=1 Tax=Bacillus sp. FSL W8-0223 TaxID=2954595 RepID=UPI0030F774C6